MTIKVFSDRIEFTNYTLRIDANGIGVTPPASTDIEGTFSTSGGQFSFPAAPAIAPATGITVSGNSVDVGGFAFAETPTGISFSGATYATEHYAPHAFQGTVAAFASGSYTGASMDKWPFATDVVTNSDGRALSVLRYTFGTGQSSATHGYASGGNAVPSTAKLDIIDRYSFASTAAATDVGNLTVARREATGTSSEENGYASGGFITPTKSNVIDKFPFASNANATDVGDLTVARDAMAGMSSTTHGYSAGGEGYPPSYRNVIDKFPFASNGNATDVGDLLASKEGGAGHSSVTYGYFSGGTYPDVNVIQKFPFATNANATDVGDLIYPTPLGVGISSTTSGYNVAGLGFPAPRRLAMQKFPFATNANASLLGDTVSGAGSSQHGTQY